MGDNKKYWPNVSLVMFPDEHKLFKASASVFKIK